MTLTADEPHPEGTVRVVHLEFKKPSGEPCQLYEQNIMVLSMPHAVRIPIVYNDPAGNWSAQAHDLLSGQVLQGSFNVTPKNSSFFGVRK